MLLAHGVGTRSDLPIPLTMAVLGAGLAVVLSFVGLALLWRQPRLTGAAAGTPIPAPAQRFLDSASLRFVLRAATAVIVAAVVVVGFFGRQEVARNLAPWALYVTFWVGLVPMSLLFGPVWRLVNPLRSAHALLTWAGRIDPEHGLRALPRWLGYWPAAVSLAGYAWLELVCPVRSDPRVVAGFVLGYSVVHTAAAVVFGRGWFARGDGFEVYSTLIGSLSPLGRRADGRLVVRSPLNGLDTVEAAPGLVGVVVVLIGSTAFDGLSRTSAWQTTAPGGPVAATVGYLCSVAVISALYLAGARRTDLPTTSGRVPLPTAFAHSVVPIAAGYVIAHYFSLLVFDGQQTLILASDPLGTGADLFGTAGRVVDYSVVGVTTIAVVQLAAIVVGHLVAVVSAHDRAVRLFPAPVAVGVQYPLLATMVLLTTGAVGLIFAP